MKIGILTFWWSNDNYGQLLQCYALQKYLRDMGHEAFLIRYKKSSDVISLNKRSFFTRIIKLFNPKKVLKAAAYRIQKKALLIEQKKNNRCFDDFREKYIAQSEIDYASYSELCRNPPKADVYIAGSDQIWNFTGHSIDEVRNCVHAMFLDFGNASKFSYAASWVMTSLTQEYIDEIKPLLADFKYVSVREKKGIDLCGDCGRGDAECVCDPTFLLNPDIYRSLYRENPIRKVSKPFLLLYMLNKDMNEYDFDIQTVYKFASQRNLEVIYVTGNGAFDKRKKYYATIPEWLWLVDNAEYVVTNSFHCSVFSLFFQKKFAVVPLSGSCVGMNTRFDTLFSDYGVQPRYLSNSDFSALDLPPQTIQGKVSEKFLLALQSAEKQIKQKKEETIRVCFITEKYVNPFVGGTERITLSVANGLKENFRHYENFSIYSILDEIHTTAFEGEKQCSTATEMAEYIKEKNVAIVVCQGYFRFVDSLRQNMQILVPNAKLVFAHHFEPGWEYSGNSINALFNEIITKRATLKTIIKILLFPYAQFRAKRLCKKRYRLSYDYSEKIVLLSKNFILPFQKILGFSDTRKFSVIPNMLSYNHFLQEDQIEQKENTVLIVSRLVNYQKRILLALKIWNLVKKSEIANNWKLEIVGEGSDKELFESYAKKKKIKDVFFIGRREPKEFYEKSSLFMMTSKSEAWGLTLTEAQQFGCVPIAFNTYASLTDIITDGENGYIIPEGKIRMYAEKMLHLMKDEELRKKIAMRAIESAKRFDSKLISSKWDALFTSLINGGDCLKTQMRSVESYPNKPKTTLNMDSDSQKLSQNVVFRRSGGGYRSRVKFAFLPKSSYSWRYAA